MRAQAKYFEWPDLERDPASPSDQQSTLLVFAAGPLGEPGEETFQVTVCTPEAADLVTRDGVVVGRHFMFVASMNTTWTQLAEKIGRIGYWVFEDYTPSQ
jgi:hypothetical protein